MRCESCGTVFTRNGYCCLEDKKIVCAECRTKGAECLREFQGSTILCVLAALTAAGFGVYGISAESPLIYLLSFMTLVLVGVVGRLISIFHLLEDQNILLQRLYTVPNTDSKCSLCGEASSGAALTAIDSGQHVCQICLKEIRSAK